jgi:hypothetical protein
MFYATKSSWLSSSAHLSTTLSSKMRTVMATCSVHIVLQKL